MKFLPNDLTKMFKFGINTRVLYPKMYFWSWKKQKLCTFYTKNEVFAKKFHQNVQILDKNWSFLPKNVHLVQKNGKNCTFYTKTEVFAQKFHPIVQVWDKNCSFVPKNAYLIPKKKKLYFLHYKCSFCQKISLKCTNFG